ncbi:Peptidase A8, signal peptidase II [Candidatus Thiomargarita nelsonii]|uniref:Peptidase A8, signal peptidase II n=1 Tax=Candidatus Thiomargarita nelsonii TaxID=1003181 RepID=A0A176RW11_9GAMM|nr:Peptidase A8, signal peptidase II [Candidatus Thiomargarita nelsonii]
MYGYVVDFIDVYYQQWHWPAFNIADSAISVGAVMLLIDALRRPAD